MNSLTSLLALSFLSTLSFGIGFGCRCGPQKVDTYFCSSDFAIEMRVTSERHDTDDQLNSWYDIEVNKVFKADDQLLKAFDSGRVWTSANSASCGRLFRSGQEYVITGFYDQHKNQLRTHTCTFGRQVSNMSADEKKFYDSSYKSVDCAKLVN